MNHQLKKTVLLSLICSAFAGKPSRAGKDTSNRDLYGRPQPSPSPTLPFTCSGTDLAFDFTVNTDDHGEETSWEVVNAQGEIVLSGDDYASDQTYNKRQCIPVDCYWMTIYDTYGDGLSDGSAKIGYKLVVDGRVKQEGARFDFEVDFAFGSCNPGSPTPTPLPTPRPTPPPHPSPSPTSSPTPAPLNCAGTDLKFDFTLNTDDFGTETSWDVVNAKGEKVLSESGFANHSKYRTRECIPIGCYWMTIYDTYGDGLSEGDADTGYKLVVDGLVEQESGGVDFGVEVDFEFGICFPTAAPQPSPSPTSAPTLPPLNCSGTDLKFDFTLNTDDFGTETSWDVVNAKGEKVLSESGFANHSKYITQECIPNSCYWMTIYDTYGDGLSEGDNNTGYKLVVDGRVEQEAGGVDFGVEVDFEFGNCNDQSPTPPPQPSPSPISPPNLPPLNCSGTDLKFDFTLNTDDFGTETSWDVVNAKGEKVLSESGFANHSKYITQECIPNGCYWMTIYDTYGDDLSEGDNNTGYKLIVDGRVEQEAGGVDFGVEVDFEFGNCSGQKSYSYTTTKDSSDATSTTFSIAYFTAIIAATAHLLW
eukprot:scaffold1375_cov137-Cylindrotheca_fusiformis.AAC.22